MMKYTNLAWLALALMTAATATAQTYNGTAFTLNGAPGVGIGQFTNGNGDAATFSTVDTEIDSWWGLGIKSQCCSSYSGYGTVFDTRSGSIYTQGRIGVGTATPLSQFHVISAGGFGGENSDGTSQTSTVPIVAQSDSTAFGILNANNRQVFALNIENDGGSTNSRGVIIFDDKTNGTWYQDIALKSGNVGIGTISPTTRLEVNGSIALTAGTGASIKFPDNTSQSTAWTGLLGGGDYAESVDITGDQTSYEPGDVLVINTSLEGSFLKSTQPYSTSATGIYSTKPGVVGRRQASDKSHMKAEVPMAMTGIVPTKVSAENGPIQPGDLLVTSSTSGYAMRGTDRSKMLGAVIGKALGHLDSGLGVIEAVVALQ